MAWTDVVGPTHTFTDVVAPTHTFADVTPPTETWADMFLYLTSHVQELLTYSDDYLVVSSGFDGNSYSWPETSWFATVTPPTATWSDV